MTFQEVLAEMLAEENSPTTNYLPQGIAMAKQIEANRLAILELSSAVGDRGQATGDSTEAAKILDAMEVLNRDRA